MIRTSFFYAFFLLLVTSISLNASDSPPDRNWDYDIQSTCYNTTENNCYPLHYENSDGSPNIFANYVAYLNIICPIINLVSYKLGTHFTNKWDKNINIAIQEQLHDLGTMKNNLDDMLGSIIQCFDNCINQPADKMMAKGIIEYLNKVKCEICTNEFVDIVSQDNKKKKEENEYFFQNFINKNPSFQNLNNANCSEHENEKLISCSDQNNETHCLKECEIGGRSVYNALFKKWNHPLNWSSIGYVGALTALTVPIAFCLDVNNRAGSFIGDMANLSNAFFIPTAYGYTVFQYWLNLDRKKAKCLADEIAYRLKDLESSIEITGRIIGKMQNGIQIEPARGFIKTLLILGWPEDLVKDFIQIASDKENVDRQAFIETLRLRLKAMKISYSDEDMKLALTTGSITSERDFVEVSLE